MVNSVLMSTLDASRNPEVIVPRPCVPAVPTTGMPLLSVQPRGDSTALGFYAKPEEGAVIKSLRLGTDVPEAERPKLEVMRTDSLSFKAYIEARRNRSEAWFHEKANAVDVCNAPVPVRAVR